MVKTKFYRRIGYILIVLGVAVFITNVYNPYKFQQVMLNPRLELLPELFVILGYLAFNVFIWSGLLAVWRADTIENPSKKAKCLRIIKLYAILTVIMIIVTIFAIIIPNALRGQIIYN